MSLRQCDVRHAVVGGVTIFSKDVVVGCDGIPGEGRIGG